MASAIPEIGPSPEINLSRYLNRVHKIPMLTPDEEKNLALRWKESADQSAADRLVTSHLRLVARIAMGYRGYGLPIGEILSEGNLGMIKAVNRFDPDRGFRLATYAMWWIRASMQEYILRSWSIVKMGTTAAQKKLFFNLKKLKGQLQAIDDGDLLPEHVTIIADRLSVSKEEVSSMNGRLASHDHSLNVPLREDGFDEWQDFLVDETESQETTLAATEELTVRRRLLMGAMGLLSERERHIVTERRLFEKPSTLEQLSRVYGISRERVRQIEANALKKIKVSIEEETSGTDLAI